MIFLRKRALQAFVSLSIIFVLAACGGTPQQPSDQPSATAVAPTPTPSRESTTPSATPLAITPAPPDETATAESATASAAATAEAPPSDDAVTTPPAFETETPLAQNEIATLNLLEQNRPQRRDQVTLAIEFGRTDSRERAARTEPLDVEVGDTESFWLADINQRRNYEISATLVLALDHVLVYVEDGVAFDYAALEQSARRFNDEIYPRTRELFGSEWTPGVDGDPRLTILNARVAGAGGYFSSGDTVPRSANRFSNEREMFVINIDNRIPGSSGYDETLAHEFQHMIHWNEAERPAVWMNEGMSQLAEELNGFTEEAANVTPSYLVNPDIQLTHWAHNPADSIPHYGASYLFMTYFYEQYGEGLSLRQLIRDGAGERLHLLADVAREQNPNIEDVGDMYSDWAIANLVNDDRFGDGRYTYSQLPATVTVEPLPNDVNDSVAQFGTDYWEVGSSNRERVIRFEGSETVGVVAAEPFDAAMWWSNRGDNAHSSMERTFDLRNVDAATLRFKLWYDIEHDFDYGFVSVSTDGGTTFTTLEGRHTTTDDPQGTNWGNGYNGTSGGDQPRWVDEEIDLTPYAGQEIVLRFSLITDDAYNAPGMAIDNIEIAEIDFRDDVEADAGWTAQGFVRTDNQLPQQWEVRLVRATDGEVTPLELDDSGMGEYRLESGQHGTLVVSATTQHTTERASYQLRVTNP